MTSKFDVMLPGGTISRLVQGGYAPNTIKAYARHARLWADWAELNHKPVFPVMADDLSEYILEQSSLGRGGSFMGQLLGMLKLVHQMHNEAHPCDDMNVKMAVRGARRKMGGPRQTKPFRKKEWDELRNRLNKPKNPLDTRDLAMIGLARDCLLRSAEIVALTIDDISSDYNTLIVQTSKTDAEGAGSHLYIPTQTRVYLSAWLDLRKQEGDAPLFVAIPRNGKGLSLRGKHLHRHSVSRILNSACQRAKIPAGYSGHSCRVGMAQDMAVKGVGIVNMQVAGRWKSPRMPAYYAREIEANSTGVAVYYGENQK